MSSDVHVAAQVRNTLQQYRRSGYDFFEMSAGPSKEPAKLSRFATMIRELDEMRVAGTLSLEGYAVAVKQLVLHQQPEVTVTTVERASPTTVESSCLLGPRKTTSRTGKGKGKVTGSPSLFPEEKLQEAKYVIDNSPIPFKMWKVGNTTSIQGIPDDSKEDSEEKEGECNEEDQHGEGTGSLGPKPSKTDSESKLKNTWLPPVKTGFKTKRQATQFVRRLPLQYLQLYNWHKDYTVYGCRSHLACPSKIRIRRCPLTGDYAVQYNSDDHSTPILDLPRRGLPQHLRAEVDRRLNARDSPSRVYEALQAHDDYNCMLEGMQRHNVLSLIKNRSRVLTRQRKGPLLFETCNDLMNWAAAHEFPATQEGFDDCEKFSLHVLPQGYRSDVRGIVFSCTEVAQNILKAQIDRPFNFSLMLDGTHKFHWGGWVVLTVGVISLEWKRDTSGFSQSFRPVAYCFCESESEAAATLLLSSVKAMCKKCVPSLTIPDYP